tara:strand:+ start:1373 stop:1708 length:336 start_codon:yes stop_codon:yes gene_type:complete
MTAGLYNFTCVKGSALAVVLNIQSVDTSVANLSSWNSRMQVRSTVSDTSTIIELTNSNGRLVHNNANGTITVTLTSAETNALSSGGVYDLELYDSNTVLRLIQGNFNLVTS